MVFQPVTLPFKSENAPPCPLPTSEEIRACANILHDRVYKVVAINDHIVVKFGRGVKQYEGQVLVFLERHVPTIPAPRLYAMYKDSKTRDTFLIMQRIPGERLDAAWATLTASEKDDVVSKLRAIFDNLGQVLCPIPDFYGGLDGGFLDHYLFHNRKGGEPESLGPFYGEENFVAGLVSNYRAQVEKDGRPLYRVKYYERHLPRALTGHRPRLTHGDVQQKNIIISEDTSKRNAQGDRSFYVSLVDWAEAGWYPSFWEFFCASSPPMFNYWEDDWCWAVQEFMDVEHAETAVMREFVKDVGI